VQSSSFMFSREGLKYSKKKKILTLAIFFKRLGSLTWGDIGGLVLVASPKSQP
jgi:hypothetical protein